MRVISGYHIRSEAFFFLIIDIITVLSIMAFWKQGIALDIMGKAFWFWCLPCFTILKLLSLGIYNHECHFNIPIFLKNLVVALVINLLIFCTIFTTLADIAIVDSIMLVGGYLLLVATCMIIVRTFARIFLRERMFSRRLIVLGTEVGVEHVRRTFRKSQRSGKICHWVYNSDLEGLHLSDSNISQYLLDICKQHDADEMVLAFEDRRKQIDMRSLLECHFHGIVITDYREFHEQEMGHVNLDFFNPGSMIFSRSNHGYIASIKRMKRFADVVISGLMLLLLWPLFLIIAIAIRLDSVGPIFYRQLRVGLAGRSFEILKFRSMFNDAEENGPQWAQLEDTRITRVGRILRKTRLDELPQFFNVFFGEMSLVGPRPERPEFTGLLEKELPYYYVRHMVRPGITGWAQVRENYAASVEETEKKLAFDIFYIKHMSFLLDALIILQTIRTVVWGKGAR